MFTVSKNDVIFAAVKMATKILATCSNPDNKVMYIDNASLYVTDSKLLLQATFAADTVLP